MSTLRDRLRQQRRQNDKKSSNNNGNSHKPADPKPATSAPPNRPVEADPRVILTHSCGHKIGARYIQGSKCPHCIKSDQSKRKPRDVTARRDQQQQTQRLPDRATFTATFDAAAEQWLGSLTIGEVTIEGECSGVFRLMEQLDREYRRRQQAEEATSAKAAEAI